jgi:hypothetical protein
MLNFIFLIINQNLGIKENWSILSIFKFSLFNNLHWEMILRNRNLNVQQKDGDDAAGQQQQKRKGSSGGGFGPAAVKRQAAHLIIKEEAIKEPQKDEPKPKRTCHTQSNSIVQVNLL